MALSEPFQCSNWKTVISSWNSSMVRPLLASSMKRKAPMPVLGLSASSGSPCNTTKTEDVSKKKTKQKQHKKYRVSRSFQYQFYRFVKLSDSPPPLLFFLRHILLVTVAKSARNMEMTLLKKNRECIVLSLLFLNFILDSI